MRLHHPSVYERKAPMPVKTAPKRVIVPVSLRPNDAAALKTLALREDTPASVLIRQAVRRLLAEEVVQPCG
jgi:hypothetical protein